MPLPKIEYPTYNDKLPSNKKITVTYRPFNVKEEKLLLMAAQSKDGKEIENVTKQIVNNCIINFSDARLKIENLPLFDFDYLFLKMRGKSIGTTVDQKFRCNHKTESDVECGAINEVSITTEDVFLKGEVPKNVIKLTEDMGLIMKLPTFKYYNEDDDYALLIECIDSVYDKDQQYKFKEQSKEEIVEFFESLLSNQFAMIQEYYDNIPRLALKKEFKCKKCGFEHSLEVDNPLDFFTFS